MYFASLVDYLKWGEALTLAVTRFVLVEFVPDVTDKNLYKWVHKLLMAGYFPVVAHIERYNSLRKEDQIKELAATGCYQQMNYSRQVSRRSLDLEGGGAVGYEAYQ